MLTAIVLAREDIRENDQRITLYTKERGLVTAYATGVKKIASKQSPRLEVGMITHVELVGSAGRYKLTVSEPIHTHPAMRASFIKSAVSGHVLGVVLSIVREGEQDAVLFTFLSRVLAAFEARKEKHIPMLYIFALWRLMAILGYTTERKITMDVGKELAEWQTYAEFHLERKIGVPTYIF